jgi:hypothetical protein
VKLFSVDRVNAMLPRIAPLVDELLELRRDLAIELLAFHTTSLPGDDIYAGPRIARPRSVLPEPHFGEHKGAIVRLIHRIEAFGCIVKDIDLGLLDFPAMREGVQVYLCWKAGETRVHYWHGVDEGFASRRPLDET